MDVDTDSAALPRLPARTDDEDDGGGDTADVSAAQNAEHDPPELTEGEIAQFLTAVERNTEDRQSAEGVVPARRPQCPCRLRDGTYAHTASVVAGFQQRQPGVPFNAGRVKRVQIVQSAADRAGRSVPVAAEVTYLREGENATALAQTVRPGGYVALAFEGDAGPYLAIGIVSRMGIMLRGRIGTEYTRPVPVFELPENMGIVARWLTPSEDRLRWKLEAGSWGRDTTAYSLDHYVGIADMEWSEGEEQYTLVGGATQLAQ